uniref:Uncharacterized protein n=1 Tax=Anguilla anguilla TaxID=7936 RepID=A0A0E9X3U7_ANGAN
MQRFLDSSFFWFKNEETHKKWVSFLEAHRYCNIATTPTVNICSVHFRKNFTNYLQNNVALLQSYFCPFTSIRIVAASDTSGCRRTKV